MKKAIIESIETKPLINDEDLWCGALLTVYLVIDSDSNYIELTGIRIELSQGFANSFEKYGYEMMEDMILLNIRIRLNEHKNTYNLSDRNVDQIDNVIRLKLPRFVNKAMQHLYYYQDFRTGEIIESNLRI